MSEKGVNKPCQRGTSREKLVDRSLTYRESLDSVSKQRYDDKLALIQKEDPYQIEKTKWSKDVEKWASVTYPDIVNFLLYTTSAYTLDELKSYKGLEAYNQFVSGWVRDVAVCEINGLCVHTSRVMHSQRLSEAPLNPWIIVQPEGKILAAHCNCMAGLGEACTHIGAMLFSIEASVKVRDSRTVTETKSYWLPASLKGVSYARIEDIDFTSAKAKKKALDSQFSETPYEKRGGMQYKAIDAPSDDELRTFLNKLNQTGAQSAILSVKNSFQEAFIPKALDQKFPIVLNDLLNTDLLQAPFREIMEVCEKVQVTVTKEEADSVEKATKQQATTKLWNRFRSGRITASRMYAACHSNPASPSESLIRAICNPEISKFQTAATTWGCAHEKQAREVYCDSMQDVHDNFTVEDAGFCINPSYPLIGASPDGFVSCDCCGQGVAEIKCPYCVRSTSLSLYTGGKYCLEDTPDGRRLKRNHQYYYQIQTQIFVCEKEYADFVVWTEKDIHMERVEPDSELWEEMKTKANDFHSLAVMPELVGRFFSRKFTPASLVELQESDTLFCFCRKGETDTMVACDNRNCQFQWFHLSCLRLTESNLPKGKWYCPDCSQMPEFKPKRRCSKK
ncbi:uncharacterized protein LOC134252559 [Saccostrea cucullata]|uniref:uncharacterized protein LOC134252559 n=1 Tax=Saccostrea cuccullata TaxID=36930 RepID=UPI002ECFCCA6